MNLCCSQEILCYETTRLTFSLDLNTAEQHFNEPQTQTGRTSTNVERRLLWLNGRRILYNFHVFTNFWLCEVCSNPFPHPEARLQVCTGKKK